MSRAAYIADHLKQWGVKPGGDNGSYFQVVKLLGVNVKRNSSVTVTVNGQTKTFKDGEGVTFPANAGGKQTITANAEFVGYGLSLPRGEHRRLQGERCQRQDRDLRRGPRARGADRDAEPAAWRARAKRDRAAACRGGDRTRRRRLRPRRRSGRGGAAAPADAAAPRTATTTATAPGRRQQRQRPRLPLQRRRSPRAADAAARIPTSGTSRPCSGSTTWCPPRSPRATTSSPSSSARRASTTPTSRRKPTRASRCPRPR